MASSMTLVSVVRIGPTHDNVSATILKNAVLDHFHRKHQEQRQLDEDSSDKAAVDPKRSEAAANSLTVSERTGGRFQLSNRYFNAQLMFRSVEQKSSNDIEGKNDTDGQPSAGEVTDGLFHKEDGIVLAFDAARSNPDLPMSVAASFDSLNSVHENAVSKGAGDLLRLCVGVSMGPMEADELRGREFEQEYSRRILWCLDRGYEYVEADLSAQGLVKGHNERDKEGFARIVEAIAGTVWSSAIMEKEKTKRLKQSYQETLQRQGILGHEQTDNGNSNYEPPDPSLLTKQSEAPTSEASATGNAAQKLDRTELSYEERLNQARNALLQEENQEEDERATSSKDSGQERKQLTEEREQERMMDQLDGALKQAVSIREMSRSGQLTDEERRQRAGDAAMVLMNLMNSMGVDGEEDDDDDARHRE